mmetsp:Transcript_28228/g.84991  ORF Transcript_28228/g.84991 Transcript_28228/m.84991 type:complete len:249 (-) Transcript_28228:501-1247(-)
MSAPSWPSASRRLASAALSPASVLYPPLAEIPAHATSKAPRRFEFAARGLALGRADGAERRQGWVAVVERDPPERLVLRRVQHQIRVRQPFQKPLLVVRPRLRSRVVVFVEKRRRVRRPEPRGERRPEQGLPRRLARVRDPALRGPVPEAQAPPRPPGPERVARRRALRCRPRLARQHEPARRALRGDARGRRDVDVDPDQRRVDGAPSHHGSPRQRERLHGAADVDLADSKALVRRRRLVRAVLSNI